MNFHVEAHSKDRQVEHYVCLDCDHDEAVQRVYDFYHDKGVRVGCWDKEEDRRDPLIPYLIFRIVELKDEPVLYVAGEYRPAYPL